MATKQVRYCDCCKLEERPTGKGPIVCLSDVIVPVAEDGAAAKHRLELCNTCSVIVLQTLVDQVFTRDAERGTQFVESVHNRLKWIMETEAFGDE